MKLAYGNKVDAPFARRVIEISQALGIDPSHLMACMAFETGETFSPAIKNPNSSATGLIQFMAATAKNLGTTTAALAAMSAVEQLDYVHKYFKPWKGKMADYADVYMAILWPRGIGKSLDYALFVRGEKAYAANKGLDKDKNGYVTKREAAAKVLEKLNKGLSPGYVKDITVG